MIDCKRCQTAYEYVCKRMTGIVGRGSKYYDEHIDEYLHLKVLKGILMPVVTKEQLKKGKVIK